MGQERKTVIYRGTVQGVGFRWQASRALKAVAVTGYVRNLWDGTVELVVEGTPDAVREAMGAIDDALGHLVRDRTELTAKATGEFRGFKIRRQFPL